MRRRPPRLHKFTKGGVLGQRDWVTPRLDSCPPPRGIDQADWNTQLGSQLAAKMSTHRSPIANHFRRRRLPRPLKCKLTLGCRGSIHFDVPQPAVIGGLNFELGIFGLQDAPFHVGLTRADPNFPHQDVFESQHRTPFDSENAWRHRGWF